MPLIEQIKTNINQALKANESLKVETLRGLLSAIHNREIELRSTRSAVAGARREEDGSARNASPARQDVVSGGQSEAGGLTEEETLAVLGREAKKRKEAHQIYTEAGRADLAEKESKELEIIKNYLPPEMNREEVEAVVRKVIDGGVKDFGQVMGAVVKETKGRAEPGMIKEIVEKMLAQK